MRFFNKKPVTKLTKQVPIKTRHKIPGTVIYNGRYKDISTQINHYRFNKEDFFEEKNTSITKLEQTRSQKEIHWVQVIGLNNSETILDLGEQFQIPQILLEDIVTVSQRPKIEAIDQGLLIVLKIIQHTDSYALKIDHFSLILTKNGVVTFQETPCELFDTFKQRIQESIGKIRTNGADYLMYALLDVIVDNYYEVIETISNKIELIEDKLFSPNRMKQDEILKDIQKIKREVLHFRRNVRPAKDITNRLEESKSPLIDRKTQLYFQDLNDHTTQINEILENDREMIWGLMDLYMSGISNKMNEVMKLLTIISSIFIPLTFIVGVYGMNFDNMPELHLKYGYFITLIAMVLITIILVLYFKRRKWL